MEVIDQEPTAAAQLGVLIPGFTADPRAGVTRVLLTEVSSRTIPVSIEVRGRVREDGLIKGTYVHLTERDGTSRDVFVHTTSMGGRDLYDKLLRALGHGFTEPEIKDVRKLLLDSTTLPGVPTTETLARPRWVGGTLQVPGITHLPGMSSDTELKQHYGPAITDWHALDPGDDSDAKEAWRTILRVVAKNPKLALLIGLALASIYLSRLGVPGKTAHVGGASTRGKTRTAQVAMSAVGNPITSEKLSGTWDTTYAGIVGVFKETGGMPFLLDETSLVSNRNEENLSLIPYSIAEGKERQRSDRGGNAKEPARFTLNVISTGERDLATSKGGEYARVIQLNAPLILDDDGAQIDMLHDLAIKYAGWPIWWLVVKGKWAPTELALDVPDFENPIAGRHARSLAAAKLAFDYLARGLFKSIGEEPPTLDLVAATAELIIGLDEDGTDADRLYRELWTDFCSQPGDYGLVNAPLFAHIVGGSFGTTWVVTPRRVREVAQRIGISDIRPVVRELTRDGRVIPGSKGNRARKALRTGDPVSDVYELLKPEDAASDLSEATHQSPHEVGAQ